MKIAVVSNCQAGPLGTLIQALSVRKVEVRQFMVHLARTEDKVKIAEMMEWADVIFHVPVASSFKLEQMTTAFIKSLWPAKSVVIPNLYYDGYHPDSIYVGGMNERIQGPLGDYHSRLAIFAFFNSLSADKVEKAFADPDFYSRSGYLAQRELSFKVFADRSSACDIDISRRLYNRVMSDADPCFLTFNHPSRSLLLDLAREMLDYIGMQRHVVPECVFPEFFAAGPVLPISSVIIAGMSMCGRKKGSSVFQNFKEITEESFAEYRNKKKSLKVWYENNQKQFILMKENFPT